jgi:ADP-ribosyl-[dinitrogen reductase] hydrolase
MAGPTDPGAAGNGSLMRLAPVALYYHPDRSAVVRHAADSSRTTHGTPECVDACRLFAGMLHRALAGESRDAVLLGDAAFEGAPRIAEIARGRWLAKAESQIRGSGYVVQSLEAALWCFAHTDGFEAAVLRAANLGDDADTTAAVCGQLAGAHYGRGAIPTAWLDVLARRHEIEAVAVALHAASARRL